MKKTDKQIIEYIYAEKLKFSDAQFTSEILARQLNIPEEEIECAITRLLKNRHVEGSPKYQILISFFENSPVEKVVHMGIITKITESGYESLKPFYRKSLFYRILTIVGTIVGIIAGIKTLL